MWGREEAPGDPLEKLQSRWSLEAWETLLGEVLSVRTAPAPQEAHWAVVVPGGEARFWNAEQVRQSSDPCPARRGPLLTCFRLGGCDGPHLVCLARDQESS